MDTLKFELEWRQPVEDTDKTTVDLVSFTIRLTRDKALDYLSRFTEGSSVDINDATAFYEAFMQDLYTNRDKVQ